MIFDYEVAVIGAGHAGIEAGLASSRIGCSTVVFTINMDSVGNCPCNPSIGGTAKGHLVREVDALGGEIGKTADECLLQIRMLNRGKGPAVHSLRGQIDRRKYSDTMKKKLEEQVDLDLRQAEIVNIERTVENKWILTSRTGLKFRADAVILATGTYLGGKVYIGEMSYESGPDGTFPSLFLPDALEKLGLSLRRFKTGTPARVLKSSLDLDATEVQVGDEKTCWFSYEHTGFAKNKEVCYISYTNEKTKSIILNNIDRSPMFKGDIEGTGPRYCPSIEDKIVRFKDKERHQLFIEPCGESTEEMYLQGLSSSLPEDVQEEFYRTIEGLNELKIMRPAYAIEYFCVDPTQMRSTLEFIDCEGLYGAGQFNGSSGYEEAAAQGLIAGANAALKIKGKPALELDRSTSYIGTLIDDITTKGVNDPYRMMTSRCEYRLVLRQDNADERLTSIGRDIGLVDDIRWNHYLERKAAKEDEVERIRNTKIKPTKEINDILVSRGTSPITEGTHLIDLLKRSQISYNDLTGIDITRPQIDPSILEKVETEIKYEGYIARQQRQIDKLQSLEKYKIPQKINYNDIDTISLEAREKLTKVRPENLGQASRISGITPADISVLMVVISKRKQEK